MVTYPAYSSGKAESFPNHNPLPKKYYPIAAGIGKWALMRTPTVKYSVMQRRPILAPAELGAGGRL